MGAYIASLTEMQSLASYNQAIAGFLFPSLSAGGLIQTADTGQTANGSFGTSSVNGTSLGYQIWRFNDTLQSTVPIFIKIELVCVNSNNLTPIGYGITIGKGSDGVGNITGILQSRVVIGGSTNGTTAVNFYCSAASNRLTFMACAGSLITTLTSYINIERSKDSSGVDTNAGVIFQAISSTSGSITSYTPYTGNSRGLQTSLIVPVPPATASMANGANIGVIPVIPFDLTGPVNPGNNTLIYYGPDIAVGVPISLTIHGGSHTYMPLGAATPAQSANWATSYILMIYE